MVMLTLLVFKNIPILKEMTPKTIIIVHHTLQQYCMDHGISEIVTEATLKSEQVSDHCPIMGRFYL